MQEWAVPQTLCHGLEFFQNRDENTCISCCKVAGDFLRTGINQKMYNTAAGRLGVPVGEIRAATESLMHLMTDAAKANVTDSQLSEALSHSDPPISPVLVPIVVKSYSELKDHLRQTLSVMLPQSAPNYKGLQWRLDIEVASRANHNLCRPVVELSLLCDDHGTEKTKRLQTDVATLAHVTNEMEKALAEIRSREYRKVARRL